ncbi:unnamed protein product [Pleuronectes platessa]|uniref:Uncharacterized protein n=1 Tax=Pleuronectes platessa TaxID=8262 RepID=A0A9N7UAH6_PLEPL|nr:unnamed protein product [Pleuronectes platessa]
MGSWGIQLPDLGHWGKRRSKREGDRDPTHSSAFFILLKSRMASCGSCFWSIVWLVVLLVLGWPLSIALGGLYGLVSPLTTCLGPGPLLRPAPGGGQPGPDLCQ